MSVRVVCNVVYALMVEGLDGKERERFDADLYAPIGGWEEATDRLFDRIDETG